MKVGILTFQDTTNYGALLQAVALSDTVKSMGCDCRVIDYQCPNIIKREISPVRLGGGIKKSVIGFICNRLKKKKHKKMRAFAKRHLTLTQRCERETIAMECASFDKIIVGSDMIWEMNVTGGDYTYFLDFEKSSEKKYSYAASFGYDKVPDIYEAGCSAALRDFAKITVREEQGRDIVRDLTGIDAPVVLDPTLLLGLDEWKKYFKCERKHRRGYVLVYFDDKEHNVLNFARRIAEKRGLDVIYIDNRIKTQSGVILKRLPGVDDFLSYIYNAECIVTASYHGVCFAVNFNKQFYYYNRAHKGRMETLVDSLDIKLRNIAGDDTSFEDIDYESVNVLLATARERSRSILMGELE